ncbi:MAG: MarR family winged helix-turn-helix transcriptional regulator [Galbitalea sp.]
MTESEQLPIGMLALQLHRAFEAECFERLAAAGFTGLRMRHSILLEALGPEGSRITTLAAQLGMSKQAMGELVDDLESGGYLERRSDPTDRRARIIRFTARGQRALAMAYEIIPAIEREYAQLVGAERYRDARGTLGDLVGALAVPNGENP